MPKNDDMWERERGTKREEVPRYWRKLHNEEHHNLYLLSNNSLATKRRTMRREENVTHKKENKNRDIGDKTDRNKTRSQTCF